MTSADLPKCRKIIRALRSGIVTEDSAELLSVGTESIQSTFQSTIDRFRKGSRSAPTLLVQADWGFGKTHLKMLMKARLRKFELPFVDDAIDGKSGSLSHLHRCLPRWLERLRSGDQIGLQGALETMRATLRSGHRRDPSHIDYLLDQAMNGDARAWSVLKGHEFAHPDYGYQHVKALNHLVDLSKTFSVMDHAGLVLLLDEAENISRQYSVAGRRKTYDTLQKLRRSGNILTVLFVTERFFEQVREDKKKGVFNSWFLWTDEAKQFINSIENAEVLSPPTLNNRMAYALVDKIVKCYQSAYRGPGKADAKAVIEQWRATSTQSTRLLIRLAVEFLDLSFPA